jgi:hypothetical protein
MLTQNKVTESTYPPTHPPTYLFICLLLLPLEAQGIRETLRFTSVLKTVVRTPW